MILSVKMAVPIVKRMKRTGRLAYARATNWLSKNADENNPARRESQ